MNATANDNSIDNDGFRMGETKEVNGWRIHRYSDSIKVTELANAGKRGKTVTQVAAYGFRSPSPMESNALEFVMWANRGATLEKMLEVAQTQAAMFGCSYETQILRGVDVKPGGFQTLEVHTEVLYLKAEYDGFMVRDNSDQNNLPTYISLDSSKKSIPAFYRWVKDNLARIPTMTFQEVIREASAAGVVGHRYCAMD
jgi:hypothetical protein